MHAFDLVSFRRSRVSRVGPRSLVGWLTIAAALGSVALAAAPASAQPIRIGMINAQSGLSARLGLGMYQGASAVLAELNHQGGIGGRPVELVVADDRYEPDIAAQETLRLIQQDEVVALLGFVGTPTTNAALPIAHELGVALLGPFTGAMSLRSPPTPEIFNLRASYDDETEALVTRLLQRGARSIGVAYQLDGFGMAVLGGVERALARRGLKVAATGSFARNSQAVGTAIASLGATPADAIVIAAPYEPTAKLVKALREGGSVARLATVSFVGTDELLPLVGTAGEGMLISQVVPPLTGGPLGGATPIERQCRRLVGKHAKVALSYVNFEGCIGAKVLVEALRRTPLPVTRTSVLQALGELQLKDFGGLDIDFTQGRRQAMAHVFLTEVQDGAAQPIETLTLARRSDSLYGKHAAPDSTAPDRPDPALPLKP